MAVPMKTSSMAVLQSVAWINKMGFRAVPLRIQSKAAISRDYVDSKYKSPPDDFWKRGEYGVGVVTGPQHSGPVDVDLDCEPAVYFAQRFMSPTDAVFGRASKQRSHYLYRVDTPEFEKRAFIDPVDGSTIIELRGDAGHQTVMPGSIHEDTGELIEWAGVPFPEVGQVAADALQRAAKKVAIATIIARHIWAEGFHNAPCMSLSGLFFYLDWTLEETEELLEAVMSFSDDHDKSRIPTIRATFKRGEAGKKIAGANVLRKQLNNDVVVDRLLEWAGSETINLLNEYNSRFACVSVEGKFRIAAFSPTAGEPPTLFAKDDFLAKMATDYTTVEVDGKIKTVPKAQLWLKSPRRRSYDNVDFLPGQDSDGTILNLWGGWSIQPDKAAYETGGCDGFLDLVYSVICGEDGDLAIWLMNWLANIVREPMLKSRTAPVIIGPEGAGKSLMVAYFGVILGPAYTAVTQDKHLIGAFNRHLAGTLLLHSEEALYGGDRKHASVIRSLITDEFRMFEQKGLDAKKINNFLRLIMVSNSPHAAPAMPGDRRYTVIDMGSRKAHDALIEKVLIEKTSNGPAALFHYLLNEFDYDPKLAWKNVKNDQLSEMKTHNMTPIEAWWLETLTSGTLLPDKLMWAQQPDRENWPKCVGGPALYASMEVSLRARGARPISSVSFPHMIERMTGSVLFRGQRSYTNELVGELGVPQAWTLLSSRQLSYINFPTLVEAREGFDRYLGQKLNWASDDGAKRDDDINDGPGY